MLSYHLFVTPSSETVSEETTIAGAEGLLGGAGCSESTRGATGRLFSLELRNIGEVGTSNVSRRVLFLARGSGAPATCSISVDVRSSPSFELLIVFERALLSRDIPDRTLSLEPREECAYSLYVDRVRDSSRFRKDSPGISGKFMALPLLKSDVSKRCRFG